MKLKNHTNALLFIISAFTGNVFAQSNTSTQSVTSTTHPGCPTKPQGWSMDLGGTYTWMSFTTPPTYSGSTGGVQAKVTYQKPWAFFGQARSFYNLGTLSSSLNNTNLHEWYMEFVGGYCLSALKNWSITPYVGLGIDYLHDYHHGYYAISPIKLRYSLYYAVAGFDTHYTWRDWMLGLQVDCLPTFNQYLNVKSLPESAWELKNRTGAAVRIPVAYRFVKNYWLELTPYYRWLPIGKSEVLGLPHRNLSQWGGFVTFRFFI